MISKFSPDGFCSMLRGVLLLTLLCGLSVLGAAQDRTTLQASFENNQQPIKIDVQVGQSRVIDFEQDYERLSISDPKIAETVPISFKQVLVNGLTFGQVNLVAWSKSKSGEPSRMLVFDIFVQVNLSLIDNQMKILFPRENIQLSQANNSVVLSGSVTRPEMSEQAQKIIEAAGLKVTNLLKSPVLDAAQVQLQIRLAEVNRNVLRELSTAYGIPNSSIPTYLSSGGPASLSAASGVKDLLSPGALAGAILPTSGVNLLLGKATGSPGVMGFIRAMHTRGAIRDLAEPNLIAMHGQKASFLAGGEFPIPIVQNVNGGNSTITIQFKEFGVKLDFVPTILDESHIRLELMPEVSSLDYVNSVSIQGTIIPGLRTRRAKTTIELRDGQSFALAGLIDNSERVNLSKIPLISEIPILGELFKSRSFQRNETELLFLATVKLVEPLNPDQLPRLPGVSELKPIGGTNNATPASTIDGQSGHSSPLKSENSSDQIQPVNPKKVDRTTTANISLGPAVQPNVPAAPDAPIARPEPQRVEPAPQVKAEAPKPEGGEPKSPPPDRPQPAPVGPTGPTGRQGTERP